jgi:PAS domain S-box-containing protein
MTILNDPFFQALFNTPVPRAILEANAPEYTIVASNDAYKRLSESENQYIKGKILRKVADPDGEESQELEITTVAGANGGKPYLLISIHGDKLSMQMRPDFSRLISEGQQKNLANIIKHLPAGLAILRGEDLVLEVVNEGMLKIWNKDESIFGKKLLDFLPEIREQEFPRLLKEVYTTGIPYYSRDAQLQVMSTSGLQLIYVDFSYTALKDDQGNTESILVLAEDVTERTISHMREQSLTEELTVINEELAGSNEELAVINEELSATNEELIKSREDLDCVHQSLYKSELKFRKLVQQAPVAIGTLNGPVHIVESANDMMLSYLGKTHEIIGQPLSTALPEAYEQPLIELLDQVYASGEFHTAEERTASFYHNGLLKKRYFTYIFQPIKDEQEETRGLIVAAIDVTTQVIARKEAEASEKRFRFLLDAMPQQVWTASPSGLLDYVNQVMCTDFGKPAEALTTNGWQQYLHPDDFRRCMHKYLSAIKNGQEFVDEFRLLLKDGHYHWHLGRLVPLIDNKKIQLWIGTNTNIDTQKATEIKKDEFLSIASHELKTPLTSIKAFNQLMMRANSEDKVRTFVGKSSENILHLERLISDLLDVTKINAGKMIYNMKSFNFKRMLEESVENVQHTTSHQIILEQAPEVEYVGDVFRLEQVVHNFLNNAIKYSPKALKVIVNAKIEREHLIVSVQDFGIGIPERDRNKLFERYFRADNTAMRFEGLGLGLYISSEILKRHRGSFWIESEEGQGSTFFFELPLQRVKPEENYTISYNEAEGYLYADWLGFQNIETVQSGCMAILEALKEYSATKLINDNTNVLGSWSESLEWVAEIWFPMMKEAGLRYLAWIYSPATYSILAAQKSVEISDEKAEIKLFTELSLAKNWINAQP